LTPADKYIEGLVDDFSDWTHEAKSGEYRVPNHSKDTVWAPQAMADLARECLSQLQSYHHKSFDYFVGALGNGTSARGLSDGLPGGTKIIGVVPSERPHEVYGTSAGTEDVTFPNLEVVSRRLERTLEISSDAWRETFWELQDKEALHVGRSTALCVAAAKLVAAGAPRGSNILVLGYDAAWRYLELETAREGSDGSEPLNSITTKR
jgi:cysteine synthase